MGLLSALGRGAASRAQGSLGPTLRSQIGKDGVQQLRSGEMFGITRQEELVNLRAHLERTWHNTPPGPMRNQIVTSLQRVEQELAGGMGYPYNKMDYSKLMGQG